MAKKALVGQFARAGLNVGTDAELREEAAEAAAKMASFVPEVTIADLLWSPPGDPLLYQCMIRGVFSFLRSHRQDAEFAASNRRRSVHYWSKQYESRLREVDIDVLRLAYA